MEAEGEATKQGQKPRDERPPEGEEPKRTRVIKVADDWKRNKHWKRHFYELMGDKKDKAGSDEEYMMGPRERKCAVCGQVTTMVCAGCKGAYLPEEYTYHIGPKEKGLGIAYCGRKCQKADWHRHRKSCKRIDITVRMMSGEEMLLEGFPIKTNLTEIAWKVTPWVYNMQTEEIKQEYDEEDVQIEFIYKGERKQNWHTTIDELGMKRQDELMVVVTLQERPGLCESPSERENRDNIRTHVFADETSEEEDQRGYECGHQ